MKSGKYNTCVFKGHVGITFWGGIVAQTGPHLGVDHDSRIWNDTQVLFPMRPGEWGLGDLAYEHCERIFLAAQCNLGHKPGWLTLGQMPMSS